MRRTRARAVGWALIGGPVAGAVTATLTAALSQRYSVGEAVILVESALLGIPFGAALRRDTRVARRRGGIHPVLSARTTRSIACWSRSEAG